MYERREIEAEYTSQLKFLNALFEQRTKSGALEDGNDSAEFGDDTTLVTYPSYLRNPPTRQGPFLLQPAPHDLETDEDEPLASDISYVTLENSNDIEEDDAEKNDTSFVLISYENGKVDVCMDIAKVEATWARPDPDSVSGFSSLLVVASLVWLG